jgi:hypothetical protein
VAALNKSPEIHACSLRDVYGERPGHFVEDIRWIRDCGKAGWVALTQNFTIGRTPTEVDAIEKWETKVFSLSKADLPAHEQGLIVGRNLIRMVRRTRRDGGCFWRMRLEDPLRDIA